MGWLQMDRFGKLATIVFLAFIATPLAAQDGIDDALQSMEQIRFDAGSGVGAKWGPVQIGGYSGTLLSDPTSPSLTLYCVDFVHSVGYGNVIDVNTTNVGNDGANLSVTRLRDALDVSGPDELDSRLTQYRQATFLAAMFDSYETLGSLGFDANSDGSIDANRELWDVHGRRPQKERLVGDSRRDVGDHDPRFPE